MLGTRFRRAPPVFVVDCVTEVVKVPDPVGLVIVPSIELEDPVPGEAVELAVDAPAPKLILTTFAVSFKPF